MWIYALRNKHQNTIMYAKMQVSLQFYLIFSTRRMSEFSLGPAALLLPSSPLAFMLAAAVSFCCTGPDGWKKYRNICNSFILPLTNITIKYEKCFVINSPLSAFVQEQAFGYLAFFLSSGNFMTMKTETSKKQLHFVSEVKKYHFPIMQYWHTFIAPLNTTYFTHFYTFI